MSRVNWTSEYRKKWKKENPEYSTKKARIDRMDLKNYYIAALVRQNKRKGLVDKEEIGVKRIGLLVKRLNRVIEKNKKKKICSICKLEQPIESFAMQKWYWKGVTRLSRKSMCKSCKAKYDKKRRNEKQNRRP